MKIIQKPFDPIATRISLGGVKGVGNYLVYRGNIADVKDILLEAMLEVSKMKEEPEVDYSEHMPQ